VVEDLLPVVLVNVEHHLVQKWAEDFLLLHFEHYFGIKISVHTASVKSEKTKQASLREQGTKGKSLVISIAQQ